jgi:Xaa-Pro aminopeptidase
MMIHERPGVRPESADSLEAGMAITVEPGIYLEGEGGVRIEDLLILTEDGSEVLSRSPKELRTVR